MRAQAGLISPVRPAVMSAGFSLLLSFLACLPLVSARGEVAIPPLTSRVTDLTNTLTADQRAGLEAKLAAFEAAKGSQIAVLVVPTTQPEAIEQYSIRVVEQWKLGRKGVDDGALLLVAKDDRKMRLEVGRGLEGVVPDAVAKRITADIIAPYFKKGDFAGGITAGVERLIKVVEGEPLPEPAGKSQPSSPDLLDFVYIVVFGLVILFVVDRLRGALFGWLGGSAVAGGATGVVAWAITGAAELGITPAFIIFMLALFVLVRHAPRSNFSSGSSYRSRERSSGGGWSSGGSSGGSFGSSGGGFSGGGGDFGGGGASSSW